MIKQLAIWSLAFWFFHPCFLKAQDQKNAPVTTPEQVTLQVDLAQQKGKMDPVWAWFGYDEPNYTYMKDGQKLLSELAALSPVPVYVRAHNLLTTGDGTPALKWGSTNA
jgi:xylan 1,4-beta-xylosidase